MKLLYTIAFLQVWACICCLTGVGLITYLTSNRFVLETALLSIIVIYALIAVCTVYYIKQRDFKL
jgi:hypothetical protein